MKSGEEAVPFPVRDSSSVTLFTGRFLYYDREKAGKGKKQVMKQILIVEDDKKLNEGLRLALRSEYGCIQAFTLQEARERFQENTVDLLLLDVNLPDGSGLDFMTEIRKKYRLPIILLTANQMEMDIVSGLEMGADDYITKPFSLMVLRARIGVQLRKSRKEEEVYWEGKFSFDFKKMEFFREGESLELSKTEQRLLRCLIENRGRQVSRSHLIDYVWQGETQYVEEHALTVAVNRLRNKLGDNQEYIKTLYGTGYIWNGV